MSIHHMGILLQFFNSGEIDCFVSKNENFYDNDAVCTKYL